MPPSMSIIGVDAMWQSVKVTAVSEVNLFMEIGSNFPTSQSGTSRPKGSDRLAFVVVLTISVVFAAHLFSLSWPNPRWHWTILDHDRNGHYEYGLNMGLALRQGNLPQFFANLEKGKVWPPVHGLLVAAVVVAAGPDYRLAVLPSLAGWIMTVVFGCLAARRLLPSPGGGILAMALTATFIAASPAYRIYATDVMLESLGAGLTMLTLYLYLRMVQTPGVRWQYTALAVTMTVLFFEKYNYWVLVVLALLGDQLICEWPRNLGWLRTMGKWPWRAWLKRQWYEPLNYLFAGLVGAVIAIQMHGPASIELLGRQVSLYPPQNLTTVAYAIFLIRVLRAMFKLRPAFLAWLGVPGRRLLWGVMVPIAVSFLLPQRLSIFLWYSSPQNKGGAYSLPLDKAFGFYVQSLIHEYHPAAWCLLLVVVLATVAVVLHRHLQRGWLALALLAGLSMVLVTVHPNQQTRFLHSWLPALWVLAGAGAGALLYYGSLDRLGRVRPLLAAAVVIALLLAIGPAWRGPGFAAGCGAPSSPSTLDISDAYLPYLDDANRTAVFIAQGQPEPFANWTYCERFHSSRGLEDTTWWVRLTPAGDVQRQLPAWLAAKRVDSVVVIEFSPDSPHYRPGIEQQVTAAVASEMLLQKDFTLFHRSYLDSHGCTVTLWKRG